MKQEQFEKEGNQNKKDGKTMKDMRQKMITQLVAGMVKAGVITKEQGNEISKLLPEASFSLANK